MVFGNSFISSAISLKARGVEGLLNNTAISKSLSFFAEPFAWEPKRYTNSPNPKSTRRVGSEVDGVKGEKWNQRYELKTKNN